LMQALKQYYRSASEIWKAVMLILLMGTIYTVSRWNGLRWRDVLTKINGYRYRHLSNIAVIFATIWEDALLVLLTEGIYEVRRWDCFLNIGKGVQAILSFRLRNVRDCKVGITNVGIYELRGLSKKKPNFLFKTFIDKLTT
jgi:hypothetical protein